MPQDILITPGSGEPQILFVGSGAKDTPVYLNVYSSYQSATSSGTALVFEGTEGQLFAITDNLSSGTIFSVGDITGLSLLDIDATGTVSIAKFGSGIRAYQTLELMPTGISAGQTFPLKFYELAANGSNFISVKSPDNLYANVSLTLPSGTGAIGQGLLYGSGGQLYWGLAPVSGTIISGVTYYNDDGMLVGSTNLKFGTGVPTIPRVVFQPSGTVTNPINLNIATDSTSATSSGIATLSFDGGAGQLLSITDQLATGTIFHVGNITGLPQFRIDASGNVYLAEYGTSVKNYQSFELMPTGTAAGATGPLRFYELNTGSGDFNYVALKAPDYLTTNVIFTLPSSVGISGNVLITNGDGTLTWSTDATSGNLTSQINAVSGWNKQYTDLRITAVSGWSKSYTDSVSGYFENKSSWTISDGYNSEPLINNPSVYFSGSNGIVTNYNTSTNTLLIDGSGIAYGAIRNWIKKTSDYTAVNGDKIIADTTSGSWTLTLPASPTTGQYVEITDGNDMSINSLIVARNSSTIEGYMDDVALTIKGVSYLFVYDGTTWEITAAYGKKGETGVGSDFHAFLLMGA
jgi:hypothetical protein